MFPIKDENPTESKPYITCLLIGINLLIYFYQISLEANDNYTLILKYGFKPEHLFSSNINK